MRLFEKEAQNLECNCSMRSVQDSKNTSRTAFFLIFKRVAFNRWKTVAFRHENYDADSQSPSGTDQTSGTTKEIVVYLKMESIS